MAAAVAQQAMALVVVEVQAGATALVDLILVLREFTALAPVAQTVVTHP